MDTIILIGQFAVVGVFLSAVVEYTKNFLDKSGHRTLYMLGLSVLGGFIVYFFHLIPGDWLKVIAGVIAAVNTAYLFLVRFFPNSPAMPAEPAVTVPLSGEPAQPAQ